MHGGGRRGGGLPPARARRPTRTLFPVFLLAVLVAACGGDAPIRPQTLLSSVRSDPAGSTCPGRGSPAPATDPRGVIRGHSRRESVLTCDGVALRVDLGPTARALLDLSVTAVQGPAAPGGPTAILELHRDGGSEVLLETPAGVRAWADHRVELPEGGGTLVLRSAGTAPVAWAGLDLSGWDLPESDGSDGPPSLVLVSLDTVRADHLSLYGYERPTSPNLDRLGEASLVYDRALSSSTWTLPSTATLLTGLLPSQHGAIGIDRRLSPDVVTVAERLQAAGYRTVALTDGAFAGFAFGLAQGFERYDVTPGNAWLAQEKDAAHIFGEASAWLRRNRHRPFFLFLHTYEAHQPYTWREHFADPFLAPEDRGREDLAASVDPHHPERTPEELARMVALYDGEIARADHYLGTFLDALEAEGLADEVAVVVTSDHGEEFLEHGHLEHAFGKVFDPNVHVPLVIRLPSGRRAGNDAGGGRRITTPVSGLDMAPTLLDLAGLPYADLPGRSLLEPEEPPRPVLVHGFPSFPRFSSERFRLDGAGPTAILDRPSAEEETELLRYDPTTDTAGPWREATPDPVPRLGVLVAWARAGGFFARLPDDARRLAIPDGSRVKPTALWTGTAWLRVQGEAIAALEPGGPGLDLAARGPHLLVFDLASGDGPWPTPWTVSLDRGDGEASTAYRLTAERRPPWNPFTDPLPPPGAVLPTAPVSSAAAARIDEATAKELKALGYLQ